jgi:sporulation protein YlmC with PRC-barrel domain
MAGEFLYWDDLRGKPINIAGQGRQAGTVEDFYYDPVTQAIKALRVNTALSGRAVLLSSAIASIDQNGVTIANENMLINEDNAGPIYQLPPGRDLLGFRVVTEGGRELGRIRSLLLGIYPPVALRIAAFELGERGSSRISAHEITSIGENELTVIEQVGREVH